MAEVTGQVHAQTGVDRRRHSWDARYTSANDAARGRAEMHAPGQDPEHTSLVSARVSPYRPGKHPNQGVTELVAWHCNRQRTQRATGAGLPAGQSVHVVAPASEYLPVPHAVWFADVEPAAQVKPAAHAPLHCAVVAPGKLPKRPALHGPEHDAVGLATLP